MMAAYLRKMHHIIMANSGDDAWCSSQILETLFRGCIKLSSLALVAGLKMLANGCSISKRPDSCDIIFLEAHLERSKSLQALLLIYSSFWRHLRLHFQPI